MRESIIYDFLRRINFHREEGKTIIEKIFGSLDDESLFYTLNPSVSSIFSPFCIKGMLKACKRVIKALRSNESILIFGDRDVDGIIGTFILKDFLEKFKQQVGSGSVLFYKVPEGDEGYGIVPEVIEEYRGKVSLVITVDNGISAINALRKAYNLGIDVIVTDHHKPHGYGVEKYAYAVVNPRIGRGKGKSLSGAGVVFFLVLGILILWFYGEVELVSIFPLPEGKLEVVRVKNFVSKVWVVDISGLSGIVSALIGKSFVFVDKRHLEELRRIIPRLEEIVSKFSYFGSVGKRFGLKEYGLEEILPKYEVPWFIRNSRAFAKVLFLIHILEEGKIRSYLSDYAPLVGLTVFSDSMPFVSYNKYFVREAVSRIGKVGFDGVRYIVSHKVSGSGVVSSRDLVMKVIPFINSAGRMGKGGKVISLFLEKEITKIKDLVEEVDRLDTLRRKLVFEFISSHAEEVKRERVFVSNSLEKGVISLVSTRIASKVDYPVIVMSNGGKGEVFTGSARFRRGDMFSMIKSLSRYLESFGGHKRAVGFVILESKIREFVDEFLKIDYARYREPFEPVMKIDIAEFQKVYAPLFYSIEPLNEDCRPVFEDEVVVEDFRKCSCDGFYLVKVRDTWALADCDGDCLKGFIGKKVRILYSYEFRFDPRLQEDLFYPKILEIGKW